MNIENLQVIAAGRDSAFWKALRDELLAVRHEAAESLVLTPPERLAEICENQQIVRMADRVISLVEGSTEELKLLEGEENG